MTQRDIVYFDLDGVIFDFETEFLKQFKELGYDVKEPKDCNDIDTDRMIFRKIVIENNIFEKLNPLSNAQNLLDGVFHLADEEGFDVGVLSSTGRRDDPENLKAAAQQKKNALEFWFPDYKFKEYNFVESKIAKAQYAREGAFLIDDNDGCIKPFIEAGGAGVLHDNKTYLRSFHKVLQFVLVRNYNDV